MLRWGDKRYYSLDYALKQRFKEKVYKIALNGNMTCPNPVSYTHLDVYKRQRIMSFLKL